MTPLRMGPFSHFHCGNDRTRGLTVDRWLPELAGQNTPATARALTLLGPSQNVTRASQKCQRPVRYWFPMNIRFNETKATRAAAHLIKRRGQAYMSYMKLIKLLYLADREALLRWGSPITADIFYSTDRGPAPSRVHDIATEGAAPEESHSWGEHLQPHGDHEIRTAADPSNGELSEPEVELLDETFTRHRNLSSWAIVDEAHELPEWEHPRDGRIPIGYFDILRSGKNTPQQIEAILRELPASKHTRQEIKANCRRHGRLKANSGGGSQGVYLPASGV